MATGDSADMASRIYAVLPGRWFPPLEEAPILSALLTGIGTGWSFCFGLLDVARMQARLATASGSFLDMISADYFGVSLRRQARETDDAYRARIANGLVADHATRAALINTIRGLTGHNPTVFEPMRPADTGGYGSRGNPTVGGGLGYGVAGHGYGSLTMAFAFFVDVHRPNEVSSLAAVSPYGRGGRPPQAIGSSGGYGAGALEYLDLASFETGVSDADILAAVVASIPAGVVAWIRLT